MTKKLKPRNPIIDFNKLEMFFGEPYVIDLEDVDGKITIYQPTIGAISKIGEKRFYTTLNVFITNTTSYRLILWELGLDWNVISDFDLFCLLYKNVDKEVVKMIFGDLDFSKFKVYTKEKDEQKYNVLWDEEDNIEINENVYFHISQYLREVFNIYPEEKITTDRSLKEWYINKDKREQTIEQKKEEKGEKKDTSIQSLISSCVNHPGFKYNLQELRNVGVCQFYDSVKRLQIYENSTAMLKGMYSGFVDAKSLDPDDYNFMKNI